MKLEVCGLSTGYRDVRVVHDVSLEVESGRVTALLGRNGAGKTTVLQAIAGLNPSQPGAVLLDGEDIGRRRAPARVRAGIGLVQEGKRVFRGLSVEQNLTVGAYSQRLSRHELDARRAEMYELLPVLHDKRTVRAGALSGGQQQMLAIAQTLMAAPDIVMLDEPSAGLAPAVVAEIRRLLEGLRDRGLGVLLVEQSVDFALAVADAVVVVDLGRDVLRADPRLGDPRPAIEDAYMGRLGAGPSGPYR
jgi:branched-chain amino acid transport system ATP-binding protein